MRQETLEQRLKRLEEEQARQDHDLNELRDLEEILRLQKRLEEIANDGSSPAHAPAYGDDVVLELENELENAGLNQGDKDFVSQAIPDIELPPEEKGQIQSGYVVCLMFNKKSPSEWSDEGLGGWRERGHGRAYPSVAAAEKQLAKLKAQFPDYPLKIFRRI
ncbi:hypothetical protein [Thioflexithrix psekupsensis]|uniref:Uncharacterized protein n=1 Tax=Thioflexithrix psekupsensis TaxID=1570016 RepID=A0A251XA05_9GAMM|nr:hypothetical protein [Thioflexithrix psekupsensis]OUD14352.1 hypothetical protein TPSD3_08525 [Thioflexithrix psekupsensis]